MHHIYYKLQTRGQFAASGIWTTTPSKRSIVIPFKPHIQINQNCSDTRDVFFYLLVKQDDGAGKPLPLKKEKQIPKTRGFFLQNRKPENPLNKCTTKNASFTLCGSWTCCHVPSSLSPVKPIWHLELIIISDFYIKLQYSKHTMIHKQSHDTAVDFLKGRGHNMRSKFYIIFFSFRLFLIVFSNG